MNDLFKRRKKKAKVAPPAEAAEPPAAAAAEQEQNSAAAAPEHTQPDKPVLTFGDLGLAGWLVQACDALGLKRPSAIQRLAIPPALAGSNVCLASRRLEAARPLHFLYQYYIDSSRTPTASSR